MQTNALQVFACQVWSKIPSTRLPLGHFIMKSSYKEALKWLSLTTLHHEDFPWRCPAPDCQSDDITLRGLPTMMNSTWLSHWPHFAMRTSREDALHMSVALTTLHHEHSPKYALHKTVTLTTLHHEDFPWRWTPQGWHTDHIALWGPPMKMPSIWLSPRPHCSMRTSNENAVHMTVSLTT